MERCPFWPLCCFQISWNFKSPSRISWLCFNMKRVNHGKWILVSSCWSGLKLLPIRQCLVPLNVHSFSVKLHDVSIKTCLPYHWSDYDAPDTAIPFKPCTPPKFHIAPEELPLQKESSFPTIFSGDMLNLGGAYGKCIYIYIYDINMTSSVIGLCSCI